MLKKLKEGTDMAQRRLTTRFETRCSPEELVAWHKMAEQSGLSLSAYVRLRLKRQGVPVRSFRPNPILLRQVAAIGNNFNQLAHWVNMYKSEADAGPVEEGIKRVQKALDALLMQSQAC